MREVASRTVSRRWMLLALLWLGGVPDPASAQQTVTIEVFNFDFGNATTGDHINPEIQVGDTVRWVFVNGVHSTTSAAGQSESWDSGLIFDAGATFTHTFNTAGTFSYYCSLHGSDIGSGNVSGMSGFVTVTPVPEPASVLGIAALAATGVVWVRRRRSRAGAGETAPCGARSSTAGRAGVSLIELLVAVTLVATLGALLLPAVQRTREAQNRTVCRHHLRQLALATHNYEAAHGHFPGVGRLPHQDSVAARLLPFLEQDALHASIDRQKPLFIPIGDYARLEATQRPAAATVVRQFLCPSDGQPPVFAGYDQATLAGGNYVANAGTGLGTTYDFRHPTDGLFWYGSSTRCKDVVDGLSNTLLFSEALLGTGADVYRAESVDPRRHWLTAGCHASPAADRPGTTPPLNYNMSHSGIVGMYWRGDRNISWVGGPGQRTLFNTYLLPNDHHIDFGSFGLGWYKASSNHTGGVNVVMSDGSVHFIRDGIDLATWRSISTRGVSDEPGEYCSCNK